MVSRWVFLGVGSLIAGTILWVTLMEWKALIEQDKQDLEEISAQTSEKDREKPKKQRSAEDKIGRLKYHEVLTKKVFAQNERLLGELRWIRRRLERIGEAEYSVCDVEGFAVLDAHRTHRKRFSIPVFNKRCSRHCGFRFACGFNNTTVCCSSGFI